MKMVISTRAKKKKLDGVDGRFRCLHFPVLLPKLVIKSDFGSGSDLVRKALVQRINVAQTTFDVCCFGSEWD